MHDIGHGPYSHALEEMLVEGMHHESLSIAIMNSLNNAFDGELELAIRIFRNEYHKPFLHQLVSGQLDVDRMDYLSRDSFFTGVSEGVIGYDRIIKMLAVHNGQLVVEEKAIYSIEKFLVSRRLMYWQVYLHKTVVSAEMMLVKIIQRAKHLLLNGVELRSTSIPFDFFLQAGKNIIQIDQHLDKFCQLDDYDVLATIKNWVFHSDRVLSTLCRFLVDRRLLKVKLQATPFSAETIEGYKKKIMSEMDLTSDEASYFIFTGQAVNTTYNPADERINILFKDGSVRDISMVDHALIQQTLSSPVRKYYICFLR
jgi:uncharacterized protein